MKCFRTFLIAVVVLLSACGSNNTNSELDNDLSSNVAIDASYSASFQIVRKGQSLPLQDLLGLRVGQQLELDVYPQQGRGNPVQWVSFDPYLGYFESPGKLVLSGVGKFYIAAFSSTQSDYVLVEVQETASNINEDQTQNENDVPVINLPDESENNTTPTETTEEENPDSNTSEEEIPASIESDSFIDQVFSFNPGLGGSANTAENTNLVLGPPRGCGASCGSTHVLSLGQGGEIILYSETPILNGEGVDFIVFENPFFAGGNPMGLLFAELGEVSVSQDGIEFHAFTCDRNNRMMLYPGCAGARPVTANSETNTLVPTDYRVSGGDGFDLEEVGLNWAQYIKIRDLNTVGGSGFDLDAIAIVHQ